MYRTKAFGTLAIDIAIVGETPSSIIEQKLTANIARRRGKKYRAGVNLIVAEPDLWHNFWRGRRRWVRPIAQIFFIYEQAEREKNGHRNNRMQGTTRVRADSW
jgi:hypothetical protein